jgi:hypothetical protein
MKTKAHLIAVIVFSVVTMGDPGHAHGPGSGSGGMGDSGMMSGGGMIRDKPKTWDS